MYKEGVGVAKDVAYAIELSRSAAQKGDGLARGVLQELAYWGNKVAHEVLKECSRRGNWADKCLSEIGMKY